MPKELLRRSALRCAALRVVAVTVIAAAIGELMAATAERLETLVAELDSARQDSDYDRSTAGARLRAAADRV